jgi:hypothetical protein
MSSFNKADPQLEALIQKVTRVIKVNKKAQWACGSFPTDIIRLNTYYLESAAGNHAFDDHPEAFGITKDEGHSIRRYFQEQCGSQDFKDYIQSLIEECLK